MKYILDSNQMKQMDEISINQFKMPPVVLMERAAVSVVKCIEKNFSVKSRIGIVCGNGNNGADGLAAARILHQKGYPVTIMIFNVKGSEEYALQLEIVKKLNIRIKNLQRNKVQFYEYNVIIDSIFGIGLSRNIEGRHADVISEINNSGAKVVAADIPSGVNASNGKIMGIAVKADYTVTFGYEKLGHILYPGTQYCGKVKTEDIGFPKQALLKPEQKIFAYTKKDLGLLPARKADSNKGSYGRILIVAGSENMGGAACLSALGAYRSGAGIVKVFTHKANRTAVLKTVPEAIVTTYDSGMTEKCLEDKLLKEMENAVCIIIGPGLSKEKQAVTLARFVVKNSAVMTVIDADALNLIAEGMISYKEFGKGPFVLTPHIGEMERLTGIEKGIIKSEAVYHAKKYAKEKKIICVLKDARTVVADEHGKIYMNLSGNSGMATGGSGDVLTGIIAGIYCNGMSPFESACLGVFIHGLAGDKSAQKKGEYGMKAGDIAENVCDIIKRK